MVILMFGSLDSGPGQEFGLEDLATTMTAGLTMLSCAVIGGAALAGMSPSPPAMAGYPHRRQQAVPPQAQAYPQPGAAPQPHLPQRQTPQQYGQHPPERPAG